MAACADAIAELEESKAQATVKYLVASLILSGAAFPRDRAPFRDFTILIRLRNAIMHARPRTRDPPANSISIGHGARQEIGSVDE
jgi:hypothetical protein